MVEKIPTKCKRRDVFSFVIFRTCVEKFNIHPGKYADTLSNLIVVIGDGGSITYALVFVNWQILFSCENIMLGNSPILFHV